MTRPSRLNADKPDLWKADIANSIDQFNEWFLLFAPETFRSTRLETTDHVKTALVATNDLRTIDAVVLRENPGALSTLRMCTAPPLAVDRLVGLAGVPRNVVARMEKGGLPVRMRPSELDPNLGRLSAVLRRLLDRDIFPWLGDCTNPTEHERVRAATVIADRLCGAVANPIIRNAQERRQLDVIGRYLDDRGYGVEAHPSSEPLRQMKSGTYSFRMNVVAGDAAHVNIPIDVVVQPKILRNDRLPILIEAKSAGDFTNTNKRRKEEATKMRQLQAAFGPDVTFVLFLCGYFGTDYLGYEAAEGLDWVWEHRFEELDRLGI